MIGEFELIDEIRRTFPDPEGVDVGIGDDAAVLREQFDLVTTDMLVEDVHFRLDWCDPADVGWRALAASLSDIAAMGGRPGPYVVSLAVGPDRRDEVARGVVRGLREIDDSLAEFECSSRPVGGDLSASPGPLTISITLFGTPAGERPLLRDGASPGDRVALIGRPGRSRGGLAQHAMSDDAGAEEDSLTAAYCRPTAEVRAGIDLGRTGLPSAAIDVSDGLVQDLGHVCRASDVGVRIEYERIPRDDDLLDWVRTSGDDLRPYLLAGGEDFCLLAAVPPGKCEDFEELGDAASWPYAWIGDTVPPESGVEFLDGDGEAIDLSYSGYEHFSET